MVSFSHRPSHISPALSQGLSSLGVLAGEVNQNFTPEWWSPQLSCSWGLAEFSINLCSWTRKHSEVPRRTPQVPDAVLCAPIMRQQHSLTSVVRINQSLCPVHNSFFVVKQNQKQTSKKTQPPHFSLQCLFSDTRISNGSMAVSPPFTGTIWCDPLGTQISKLAKLNFPRSKNSANE